MSIKIFIDQGHNPSGHNLGAHGGGMHEADITYNVGIYLADLLRADGRFSVRTSRTTPTEVLGYNTSSSLTTRVEMANSWPADYFLSIHANYNDNPNINGTEMYVYNTYSEAYYLAQHLLLGIVTRVGTKDNLVRTNPSLYVLRKTRMPAVLVELAYLSNSGNIELLYCCQYQFAYGLYVGLLSYFGL